MQFCLRSTLEIKSNYINIDALADFIQRKCNLLLQQRATVGDNPANAGPSRAQLQHESNAIISSLRLIFRRDEEFIALTLLRVETCPDCEAILGPVYERFLGANDRDCDTRGHPPTNVECYGRLLLCYVRWKQLYRPGDPAGHWDRIDGIALSTLPYDFPRAIKRRELALKALFPRVASNGGSFINARGSSSGQPTGAAKASVTRALLNSRHVRDNIQELCLRFLAICSDERINRGNPEPVSVLLALLNSRHVRDNIQELCLRFLAICSDERINRGNPEPIPTSPRIPSEDKDADDVEIIKTESTSIIVLDSEDDDVESTPPGTGTGTECSKMPIMNGASTFEKETPNYLDSLYDNCFETTSIVCSPPTSLMETVFNTPPPTPTDDDTGSLEPQTPPEIVGKTRTKKLFPQGVSLKISKNLRLYGDRARRNFMTAFRKLSSAKRFHVRLRTDREDYYLRKHVSNQTVFVEIFCGHGGILPGLSLQMPHRSSTPDAEQTALPLAGGESFHGSPYANLEGPILQDSPPNVNLFRKSRSTTDDQLMSLLSGIEDFPAHSPASLDFALLGEHENRSSLDLLANDHAPPSSVLGGGASGVLWQGDIFSVISSGCDFNPWLDYDFGVPLQALPAASSVAPV
ncbi:conserved hypothetical protein [Culex quinquefasciatus]|uniref:Uncharacterized protein n=1 Tax=Culex quinquefasciatus TaxID=7176 RepID=B0WY65_CULQU|nr:conserved hypothetical protein [Culex quinquefasciatus]|eukprot:XP_001862337.1 conserved hypothetical protein [Culex quinquefasciatus]